MKLTPITAKVQKQTKGGMIQEPLLNVGRVEGGSKSNCGCGSKPCKCGPESVAKKYSAAKQTAKQKGPTKIELDPDSRNPSGDTGTSTRKTFKNVSNNKEEIKKVQKSSKNNGF